jgi:hypothetical protein
VKSKSESIVNLIPALIAAQRAMGPAVKTAFNPHFKSRYVDLESACEACRVALWDQGLTVIQTTEVVAPADARLVSTLAHTSGEWIAGSYPLRPAKDDPQGLAAAVTYARRVALLALVWLAPEDDDGRAAARPARANGAAARPAAAPAPAPRLGTPTTKTRTRWAAWLEKLMDRWNDAEPVKDEADFVGRQNRIAQALLTEAGPEFERRAWKPAQAGKDPVRDPHKVWEVVHQLAAGDWEWTKAATLRHLRRHVATAPASQPAGSAAN